MTTIGWVFMLGSWTLIITLLVSCMIRVLGTRNTSASQDEKLDTEPPPGL